MASESAKVVKNQNAQTKENCKQKRLLFQKNKESHKEVHLEAQNGNNSLFIASEPCGPSVAIPLVKAIIKEQLL